MKITEILTKDELIVKKFKLRGRFSTRPKMTVYATNMRLIIDRDEYIREISYQHISSMMIKERVGLPFILLGVMIALVGGVGLANMVEQISEFLPDALSGAFLVIGLGLLLVGLIKSKVIAITVTGMSYPVVLYGTRVDLEDIFVIVRDTNPKKGDR